MFSYPAELYSAQVAFAAFINNNDLLRLMYNRITKALLWADVLWVFGEGMLGPLFAVFAEKVGGNILEISWAWAVYLWVTGSIMILVGRLSDHKVSKSTLVIIGYILNAILTFCYLVVSTPAQLVIVQAGLGVAAAFATPTWNALYSQNRGKESGGEEWGLADGMSSIFTGLAIVLGGFVVTYASFNALFILMGVIQVLAAIMLLPILKQHS